MTNPFTLINEWEDTEGHELESENHPEWGYRWPYPTQYKESRITGDLAQRIKRFYNLPLNADDEELRLIEKEISSGYSEFTQETDFEMELWLHIGDQAQKLWDSNQTLFGLGYNQESNLAKFIDMFEFRPITHKESE